MWYRTSNGNSTKPVTIDTTSSKVYVYIRKNFELIPDREEDPAHWTWDERKVSKNDWQIIEQIYNQEQQIDEVQLALCDVYEMIGGAK